jgi:hypothetical protein
MPRNNRPAKTLEVSHAEAERLQQRFTSKKAHDEQAAYMFVRVQVQRHGRPAVLPGRTFFFLHIHP